MPSNSLTRWNAERAEALDEIESAHAIVGGTERGRRYATQQINFAYAALLSSHFQGFCRDLHSECIDHIIGLVPVQLQDTLHFTLGWNRVLQRGNPHPGAIGSDFKRLGIDLWSEVYAIDTRNSRRRELLEQLLDWRNAIAHQDFDALMLGDSPTLRLIAVRRWRRAIGELVRSFDRVVYNHLNDLIGRPPWESS